MGGTQQLCGVLDYFTKYNEALCNLQANEIIVEQQNPTNKLVFCGFGVLADCSCSQTSFDYSLFTTSLAITLLSTTSLSLQITDSVQSISITQVPDTVSSVCGSADGFAHCGPRSLTFKDKLTGITISTWPYRGYNFDAVTSISLLF